MLTKVILLIDKRRELSVKYKKQLEQVSDVKVFCATDIAGSIKILNNYEPDLILVSDSIDENLVDICKKIRILSYTFRPILVALSKSEHLQDKLNVLEAGADDFLSEPIDMQEFKARINAHLRRHFDSNLNEVTQLYDAKIGLKILKRLLIADEKFAIMLISIDNYEFYKELYGDLAAEKMLQTFQAIINSAIDDKDYLGHLSSEEFLLITSSYTAEKIAHYITYAFDLVADKFYSSADLKRGYVFLSGDKTEGKKISLVSTSIGIVSNEYKKFENEKQLINSVISTHKLAKYNPGSNYVIERPKLEGSVEKTPQNNKILIVEPDEALSFLLTTAAELRGYEVKYVNEFSDIFTSTEDYIPAVIILDAGDAETLEGLAYAQKIKKDKLLSRAKIILSSVLHDKTKILNAGADLYLPKPYELSVIFHWLDKFVKEVN